MAKEKGVLLYAMNTPTTNYGRIANIAALLIERHLKLPVSVVTDDRYIVDIGLFDEVIVKEKPKDPMSLYEDRGSSWRNKERHDYLSLTPYEQTLVLDSDYLMFNDNLLNLFDTVEPLYLSFNARKTNGDPVDSTEQRISPFSLDLVWATCFYFRKGPEATRFFDLVEYVRSNYAYFCQNYELTTRMYRNDYTFAIAAHLYSEYRKGIVAPNPFVIHTAYPSTCIEKVTERGLILTGPEEVNKRSYHRDLSVHMLNKQTILEHYETFKQLFY